MANSKMIKVKFLKRHYRFAYAEGDEGTVKEAMLEELKLVEGGFVELIKEVKEAPKKSETKEK